MHLKNEGMLVGKGIISYVITATIITSLEYSESVNARKGEK